MKPIFGEFECKLDAKGRFLLPSGLKRQLPQNEQESFVVNRGIDTCLVLFPIRVWEEELSKIHAKNQYIAKNRAFARKFQSGAMPVALDGNSRINIPKRLMEYAGLSKEVVLVASFDRVEIWDKDAYEAWLDDDQFDMEKLSEEVMGNGGGSETIS